MIKAKEIDTEFFQLTVPQAKQLVCDGELPKEGHEKKAKPAVELNKLLRRFYWNRSSGKYDREADLLPDKTVCWIARTWMRGKQVWAIHCHP